MKDSRKNREALLGLAEILKQETGISLQGLREELVHARLNKRMKALKISTFSQYAQRILSDTQELPRFINLMTTNHTYFFREKPHLDFFENIFLERFFSTPKRMLNVWCAACSTGEEPYTIAFLAKRFMQRTGVKARVRISATDINTEALRIGKNAVYPETRLRNVPRDLVRDFFKRGQFPHEKYFRVHDEIRQMVRFSPMNLVSPVQVFQTFDIVFCRNVLIYFERQTIRKVVQFLCNALHEDGIFISGISEQIQGHDPRLSSLGRSINAVRDSSQYLHEPWESKGTTKRFSTIIPSVPGAEVQQATSELCTPTGAIPILAIGSSTGGVQALAQVVRHLRSGDPPCVIAQHIPEQFSTNLSETLGHVTSVPVLEARTGMAVQPGHVYVSPGGRHLAIEYQNNKLVCIIRDDVKYQFRPSVDLLFESLAKIKQSQVCAAILTGMGNDGTAGALTLRAQGHHVIAQNKETSLVYGMPGSAMAADAVDNSLPLDAIGPALLRQARKSSPSRAA